MKGIFTVFVFFLFYSFLSAQKITPQVLSNAGTVQKAGNFGIEWTLGEMITERFASGNFILTQGFHQARIIVVATKDPLIEGITFYPNPVQSNLFIENNKHEELAIQMMDVFGQLLFELSVGTGIHELSMEHLASGTYFINLKTDAIQQSIKIEKIY
ncbi:MAG: T9SS type A sorting domain-containing protein [Bacteroidota bacterium]|nr:T9SS type A sorting domain-containing protein [Bacteroidota bacterium]